jgi:hypothetical protein
MYWGGILALDQGANPERLAMAAHAFRELQNLLPEHLDVPEATERMDVVNEFPAIADKWESASKSGCRDADGKWDGAIDGPLAKFLAWFDKVIQRYVERNPRMRRVGEEMLRRLDPTLLELPSEAADRVIERWWSVRTTFVLFAHHKRTDEAELIGTLGDFENLLGDRLFPRTFEKQAEIDAIVARAEADAANS